MAGQPPPETAPHHPRGTQPAGHASQGDNAGPPHPHNHADSTWAVDPDSPPRGRGAGGRGAPDPRRTHNGERHPPGDALPPPPQRTTPARKGARCAVGAGPPGPCPPHPGHTGCGTPTARPRGRAAAEGQRLTPDAPNNGGRPPPPGQPPPPPRHAAPTWHANQDDNAGPPRPHTRANSTWVAEVERLTPDAPRNGERRPRRGHPSASARRGARRVAEAGSPRPHQPHPGHTGHGTPAAGRGTAPDTRSPSQRWQATPPGDGPPPPPRHAAPTGKASQGDSARPPQLHTRPHSTWTAGPGSPQEEGSQRRESARPRTPLATGSPILHGRRGEHLMPTRTHERQARGASVRALQPTPRRAHST